MSGCLNCKHKEGGLTCSIHEGIMNDWHVDWGNPACAIHYVKKCPYCGCEKPKCDKPSVSELVKIIFRSVYER